MAETIHDLPEFSEDLALRLMVRGADVTIHLDGDYIVRSVLTDYQIGEISLDHWTGQALNALLTPESRPKLDFLIQDNSAIVGAESRWRHLNFIVDGTLDLPLLVKLFAYRNAGQIRLLLSCRDLRPLVDIHEQFRKESRRRDAEYRALQSKLAALQSDLGGTPGADLRPKKH